MKINDEDEGVMAQSAEMMKLAVLRNCLTNRYGIP
jgi:hypothetical protein